MHKIKTILILIIFILIICISGCTTTTTLDKNYNSTTDASFFTDAFGYHVENIHVENIIVPETGTYHIHLQTLTRGSSVNAVLDSYDQYEMKTDKFGIIESKWTTIERFCIDNNHLFVDYRNLDNWNCLSNDNQNCDQNITLSNGRNFNILIRGNGQYYSSMEKV